MEWTGCRRSRTSISETAGADLLDLIFRLEAVGSSRRKIRHCRRNVPQQPVRQCLWRFRRSRRSVSSRRVWRIDESIEIMEQQDEACRALWNVAPLNARRSLAADLSVA